jgi:hypothetical protein
MALATIIAAMTSPVATNNMMRLNIVRYFLFSSVGNPRWDVPLAGLWHASTG